MILFDLDYTGKVKVAGELWSATSNEDLERILELIK